MLITAIIGDFLVFDATFYEKIHLFITDNIFINYIWTNLKAVHLWKQKFCFYF